MKAAIIEEFGEPEVLRLGDAPDPTAGPGDVVVDVHAASVNHADWQSRRRGPLWPVSLPYILGRDFSGVVREVGAGVDDLAVGDEVFGVLDLGLDGCYAEQVATKAAIVAPKPTGLSHVEAAAIALAGLTALIAVEDSLALRPGETIGILGGAGGVGSLAIGLAKTIGATVIASASAASRDEVLRLGADVFLDYRSADDAQHRQTCDAVFDTAGADAIIRSVDLLRPGGRIASVGVAEAPPLPRDDVEFRRPRIARDRAHLERLGMLVASGALQLPDITTYDLADAASAHRDGESRRVRGKMVLVVAKP